MQKEEKRAFWNRVKDLLEAKQENLKTLSLVVEVNPPQVYQWTTHLVLPAPDIVVLIADFLDTDVHWLLWGDEIPDRETSRKKLMSKHAEVSLVSANAKLKEQEETIKKLQEELAMLKEEG